MELAMKQWEKMPDGIPNGHSVCHLIESFDIEDQNEIQPSKTGHKRG
jgi:hypothetical protein